MPPRLKNYTNPPPETYDTKDKSLIRELLHPAFVQGLGISLAEAVVNAGEGTAPHRHDGFDEVYYCLEGEGMLFINNEPFPFSADMFYLLPKGASHHLAAASRLRLLCICCTGYTHEGTTLL